MKYPVTKKFPVKDCFGSEYVIDDYKWLKDGALEDVQAWLNTQHQYTDAFFDKLESFKDRKDVLESNDNEMSIISLKYQHKEFIGVNDSSKDGLTVFVSDDNLENLEVLKSAKDPYTTIFSAEFSPTDPNLYVFTGYYKNETRVSINIVDRSDNNVIDRFGFGFDFHWSLDGKYIYYSIAKTDPNDVSKSVQEIYRYDVYNNSHELLYIYTDDAVVVYFDQSNESIIVKVDVNYHDCQLLLINPDGSVEKLSDVLKIAYEYIGTIDDRLYLVSDEKSDHYQIVYFTLNEGLDNRVILDSPTAYGMVAKVINDKIVVFSKTDAEDNGKIYDKDGNFIEDVVLPSNFASIRVIGESDESLFLYFDSIEIAPLIIAFDKSSNKYEVIKELSDSPDAKNLEVVKHKVTLRDGAVSTLYLVHDKSITVDKESPLLIYGYGGYGVSQSLGYRDPVTNYSIKSWCEAGGVYANVILRGGGEYGKTWHDNGKLKNKQNTFNDLFDMTVYIHDLGISSPKYTVVGGSSNGGLLVSAAYTQSPDLYACVLDSVGLNDMLHFIKDPRGSMYKTEYGDPFEKDMFEYLKAYSPYHNIFKDIDYPAVYIHSGLLDTNVPPYHGMKFAAKAQNLNPSGNPILLRVLPNGHHDLGHGEEHYLTVAERQCFVETTLGLDPILEKKKRSNL